MWDSHYAIILTYFMFYFYKRKGKANNILQETTLQQKSDKVFIIFKRYFSQKQELEKGGFLLKSRQYGTC